MAKNYIQPVRMESQFNDAKLHTVMFQSAGSNVAVADGTIAVLGDFVKDPVYVSAYTAAGQAALAPTDLNTRVATAPAAATAKNVGVIDLATVPTADGLGNSYRIGHNTIGLEANAGVPVRFRKLSVDDVFVTSEANCTAALTVGQYAVLATGANAGKWAPNAAVAADGAYCKVIDKFAVSQGVDGQTSGKGVTAYALVVSAN